MMFKIIVLQALYSPSDDQAEFQIQDRLSFMRFLGLGLGDKVGTLVVSGTVRLFHVGSEVALLYAYAQGRLVEGEPGVLNRLYGRLYEQISEQAGNHRGWWAPALQR